MSLRSARSARARRSAARCGSRRDELGSPSSTAGWPDQPGYGYHCTPGRKLRGDGGDAHAPLVASGDCSHRLRHDGPYGVHPRGRLLDHAIIAALRTGWSRSLLDIDADVVIEGGECGLRSFILGLSALEPAEVDVRSYEAPYGVGYLVATIRARTRTHDSDDPCAGKFLAR